MSNKKRGKLQNQNRQPVMTLPSVALKPEASETDKKQNRRISLAFMGTIGSFVLNVFLAGFAFLSWNASDNSARSAAEANALTKQAQDRAAGKVRAQFALIDEQKKEPNRLKDFMRKQDGYDNKVFRIENVEELIRWMPYVVVRNTGTDPIDAIKIDIDLGLTQLVVFLPLPTEER